jgi:dimethylargininase
MIFEFDSALVRAPARSVIRGLSSQPGPRPLFEAIEREHAEYVRALEECGLSVETLPPLEDYPDSVFVEDPALVFGNGAVVLRPGAQTRLGEVTEIEPALSRRFERVMRLQTGFADGGDMLFTPRGMLIGLSRRTNQAGATELCELLQQLGIDARIVNTPSDTLHLKSDCSLIGEDHILCTTGLAASGLFDGYRKLIVPDSEKRAANSLRLNDTVLVGAEFPLTLDLLRHNGYTVRALPVCAIGKLDAGLSCMSLRWKAQRLHRHAPP